MIALADVAVVLLCAGLSRRFGPADKLLAPLDGRPLVAHAAALAGALPFGARFGVCAGDDVAAVLRAAAIQPIANPDPAAGQEVSLRIGLAHAEQSGVRAVLICLGDMPYVTVPHLSALIDALGQNDAAMSVGEGGNAPSPPTIMTIEAARRILADPGRPARQILRNGRVCYVQAPPALLADIDVPDDLG